MTLVFLVGLDRRPAQPQPRREVPGPARRGCGRRVRRRAHRLHRQPVRRRTARAGHAVDPRDAHLHRGLHQHHQPHRRARRPRGGRLGDRRRHAAGAGAPGQPLRRGRARGGAHRRVPRLPALQLPSRVDLHGRLGSAVPGVHARHDLAARGHEDDRGDRVGGPAAHRAACRSSTRPPRSSAGGATGDRSARPTAATSTTGFSDGDSTSARRCSSSTCGRIALAVVGYAVRYAPGPIKIAAMVGLFAVSAAMAYWLGLFEAAHHLAEGDADLIDAETHSRPDSA